MPHYFHDFDQCSAQSGYFCNDYDVSCFRFFEQSAQFSGFFCDLSADGLRDPFVDSSAFNVYEVKYLFFLVNDELFVRADSNVRVNHIFVIISLNIRNIDIILRRFSYGRLKLLKNSTSHAHDTIALENEQTKQILINNGNEKVNL